MFKTETIPTNLRIIIIPSPFNKYWDRLNEVILPLKLCFETLSGSFRALTDFDFKVSEAERIFGWLSFWKWWGKRSCHQLANIYDKGFKTIVNWTVLFFNPILPCVHRAYPHGPSYDPAECNKYEGGRRNEIQQLYLQFSNLSWNYLFLNFNLKSFALSFAKM